MNHTVSTHQLSNGARLLTIDTPGMAVFCFNTYVRAGWDYTNNEHREIAHLLEHLAFCGNEKYPTEEKFYFAAETYGTHLNATTTDHYIRYFYEGSINQFEQIIDLACSQIHLPTFSEEAIVAQKQVIANELSRRQDVDAQRCSYALYKQVMPQILSIEERIKSLDNINRKDILDYFNKYHVAQNIDFVVSGDLSAGREDKIIRLLNNFLTTYRQGKRMPWGKKTKGNYKHKVIALESELKNENYFDIELIQENYYEELMPAMKVAIGILGNGFGSRLFRVTRKSGLSYGPSAGFEIDKEYSFVGIKDRTRPQNAIKLFDVCLRELRDILEGNFTNAEFERAKGLSLSSLDIGFETVSDLDYWYTQDFISDKKLESPKDYSDKIRKIQPKDIKDLKPKFFDTSDWIVSIVGNSITKQKDDYKKIAEKYFG